jgi:hypothetical protein
LGASAVGGRYVTAFTYRVLALKTESEVNPAVAESRRHTIAVESREADKMRSSAGVLNARTYSSVRTME